MFNSDGQYNAELRRLYTQAQVEIQKEIDSFLQNYAGRERLSMDEARKKVTKFDVENFSEKAKKYVKERDFSEEANRQLKIYNLKMRMNRLELLLQHIRLETIALADSEDKLLTARLDEEAYKEVIRQAGILGESVPSEETLRNISRSVVSADFKGTTFSNRIWQNQTELQNELDNLIRRTLIRGENPRVSATNLRKAMNKGVKNKRHAAERIAITESGRVQVASQLEAFKEYDIKQLEVICEPTACDQCSPFDGKVVSVADARQGENVPIFHPHCRCSTSSYADRGAYEADLTARGL